MEIPYTVTARPDTGLWNAKIGVWLFLASEVMLFGGLFSSYIFLRLGADYHWPVHELNVKMGCFNTAVLIASSVTVVMAWAGVKMRNYKMYWFNLLATILCAFTFLGVKFFEYKSKIEHYGVVLKDGTILLGHLPDEGYRLKFTVDSLALGTGDMGSDPKYFAPTAFKPQTEHGGAHDEGHSGPTAESIDLYSIKFKTASGDTVTLHDWPRLRAEALGHMKDGKPDPLPDVKLTPAEPFVLHADPKKLTAYDAGSMTFLDSTKVTGKLTDDTMELHCDVVDVRAAPEADQSLAWTLLKEPEWKKLFDEQLEEHVKKHGEHADKAALMKSEEFLREALRWPVHGPTPAEHEAKHKAGEGFFDDMPWAHHHYPTVKIPGKDIQRYSNFLPAWNTYYAIYFCITGLHGLHVLAGALVMLYFLVVNSKMFKTDPEHLANRVETGGLFWHFVDLVWIFLFPLLYLL